MGNAKTVSVLFCLFLLFSCLTFTDAFFGRRNVGKRSGVNKVGYLQSYSIIIIFCHQDAVPRYYRSRRIDGIHKLAVV